MAGEEISRLHSGSKECPGMGAIREGEGQALRRKILKPIKVSREYTNDIIMQQDRKIA